VGEPLVLTLSADGESATVTGPPVQTARTRPVTAEEVEEHIGRLGGTPYRLGNVSVRLDAVAGLSFSELHRLRREAIDLLDEARLRRWSEREVPTELEPPRFAAAPPRPTREVPVLVVSVGDGVGAASLLKSGARRVIVADLASACSGADTGRLLPRVVHEDELAAMLEAATSCEGRPVAGNLGVLGLLGDAGVPFESDWGLNVVNPWCAAVLAGLGASLVWASPELDSRQLESLVSSSPVPIGIIVGGRAELMVAEHCVLQAAGACSHDCSSCARRRGEWALLDRKGYRMPVRTDSAGRAHIYNAVPLDLSRSIGELLESGVAALRLEMESSSVQEAVAVTREWRARLDRAAGGGQLPFTSIEEPSTTGHFHRGVR
jgi:putative protease